MERKPKDNQSRILCKETSHFSMFSFTALKCYSLFKYQKSILCAELILDKFLNLWMEWQKSSFSLNEKLLTEEF